MKYIIILLSFYLMTSNSLATLRADLVYGQMCTLHLQQANQSYLDGQDLDSQGALKATEAQKAYDYGDIKASCKEVALSRQFVVDGLVQYFEGLTSLEKAINSCESTQDASMAQLRYIRTFKEIELSNSTLLMLDEAIASICP